MSAGQQWPAIGSETGVRSSFEYFAHCAWLDAWADAHASGDAAAQAHALGVLVTSVDRPVVAATDGGNVRETWRSTNEAAAAGNSAAVAADLINACAGWDLGPAQ